MPKSSPLSAPTLSIAGHDLAIKRHPRRRRLSLRVRAGRVELLAPNNVALSQLKQFATKHQAWWLDALRSNPVAQPIIKRTVEDGAFWPLLGEEIQLRFRTGQRQIELTDQQLICQLPQPDKTQARHKHLQAWWREYAYQHLAERTQFFAQALGEAPSEIQIKTYRARWGSCDARRRIQYNWKLICLPSWVVDYVVVHELCHLKQMNHSPAFWQQVNRLYPDTPKAKMWLKQHGHQYIHQL